MYMPSTLPASGKQQTMPVQAQQCKHWKGCLSGDKASSRTRLWRCSIFPRVSTPGSPSSSLLPLSASA
jgi:hypothetical protein